ncbi:hypothetical protein [Deep-sea thermophilic phage D6E]|uniref:hypothetical protein n=1 Tax=Deep-sea thermophilic phage D6E TaxID=749413 RepID=UPI0001F390F3|nr:hypothetical protein F494_gp24 [Deep-sea thermophilic phage D6E]ADE87510.1 hypothetical protein [Deep-sea thermophilic phage D6E]
MACRSRLLPRWRRRQAKERNAKEEIEMNNILTKLLLLQVTVADHRLQYAMIETDDERERAFIEGVLAACEFVEEALEEMWESAV